MGEDCCTYRQYSPQGCISAWVFYFSWEDRMVDLPQDRLTVIGKEFSKPYFLALKEELLARKAAGEAIYPPGSLIFNAFHLTPFAAVQVVILGQDPYHGHGQAHGLSFSVPDGIKPPPSLQNIYKEIQDDRWGSPPSNWNLIFRAEQWVLLLNAILTVSAGKPASHHDLGWQQFTDEVIRQISVHKKGVVFLLRGSFAKGKKELIDPAKHIILEAAHPSPYSAHNGFFGCKHFSLTNQYLLMQGKQPIQRFPV